MQKLSDLDIKIRSKNAGPFWITADIFCMKRSIYERLCAVLSLELIANSLKVSVDDLLIFEIETLYVIKFSFPRPHIQGSRKDRDMHGAQLALRLKEIKIND